MPRACGRRSFRADHFTFRREREVAAGLVNFGGQLQFRVPGKGTGECYWVEVDTFKSVSPSLPWTERVEETAKVAVAGFNWLLSHYDFLEEGRKTFPSLLETVSRSSRDPREAMFFVLYFEGAGPKAEA